MKSLLALRFSFVFSLSLALLLVSISDACAEETAYSPRAQGCFAPETKIVMVGHTKKSVSLIEQGEFVWNPLAKKAVRVHKVLRGPEREKMVRVVYGEAVLEVSPGHPMIVETARTQKTKARVEDVAGARLIRIGPIAPVKTDTSPESYTIKAAKDLQSTDRVLGEDEKFHEISSVKRLSVLENQEVFNLVLEGKDDSVREHAVVANGFITGDFLQQEKLHQQAAKK